MDPIYRLPDDWKLEPVAAPLSEVVDASQGFLGLDEVHRETAGEGTLCIVLDSGYDPDHPDFAGQVIAAADFTNSPNGVYDDLGHGTHCLGIIGAAANDVGVRGVAYKAKLAVGKVLDRQGVGTERAILAGIRWARELARKLKDQFKGIVLSMSFGAGRMSEAVHAELVGFLTDGGVRVAVAAAGNDGPRGTVGFPAAFEEVISVGASDGLGNLTQFTSLNGRIDIVGPGWQILSTIPLRQGRAGRMSGTSMAAPCVAGVTCCMISADQLDGDIDAESYERVRELMIKSSTVMVDGSGLRLINPRGFKNLVDNGQPPSPAPVSELVFDTSCVQVWAPARAGDPLSIAFKEGAAKTPGQAAYALAKALDKIGIGE